MNMTHENEHDKMKNDDTEYPTLERAQACYITNLSWSAFFTYYILLKRTTNRLNFMEPVAKVFLHCYVHTNCYFIVPNISIVYYIKYLHSFIK